MSIVSLSIPKNLLGKLDSYLQEQGFTNRSEIFRQALRAYISEGRKLSELQGKLTATITIIYKSEARTGQIADIQHEYSNAIATFLHTHVEQGHCIEIIVAKGESSNHKSADNSFESEQANLRSQNHNPMMKRYFCSH